MRRRAAALTLAAALAGPLPAAQAAKIRHPSPHAVTRALPYTGIDPALVALAGLGLLTAGTGIRVRLGARRD